MTTFLFLVCFTLIGILFFSMILVYQRLTYFKDMERKQAHMFSEIEAAFTGYIMQIKEENEQLLERLNQSTKEIKHTKQFDKNNEINFVEQNLKFKNNESSSFQVVEEKISNEDVKELLPSFDEEVTHQTSPEIEKEPQTESDFFGKEQSLQEQVLSYYNSGATIEEIAKKLNKGKTEIELLLKFRQK